MAETDQSDFAVLALPLLRPLFNFAHWLSRDSHEAEDLVQETYARALKGFSGFRPGTNFRAWMFQILRNTFLTSRTGKPVSVEIEEESEVFADRRTPETVLMNATTQQQIQNALERLPAEFREVILLCDVEEMRYREIAELLGIPQGTVMSRISRARRLLRGYLAEERMRVGR
jgi:RNA polymerase sigma-70 factor (ECF subfamily)